LNLYIVKVDISFASLLNYPTRRASALRRLEGENGIDIDDKGTCKAPWPQYASRENRKTNHLLKINEQNRLQSQPQEVSKSCALTRIPSIIEIVMRDWTTDQARNFAIACARSLAARMVAKLPSV